jgi:hypothetical protein
MRAYQSGHLEIRASSIIIAVLCVVGNAASAFAGRERFDFDAQGTQIGEPVSDLTVYTHGGEPRHLSEPWANQPVLLITTSLTCPVARQRTPAAEKIASQFRDRLSVVMLYTIEAHPSGDPSPYADGQEWLTSQNEQEGILRRQPRTLFRPFGATS